MNVVCWADLKTNDILMENGLYIQGKRAYLNSFNVN